LVASDDKADAGLVPERRHDAVELDAGQAEYDAHAFPVELLHERLTAGHPRHLIAPLECGPPRRPSGSTRLGAPVERAPELVQVVVVMPGDHAHELVDGPPAARIEMDAAALPPAGAERGAPTAPRVAGARTPRPSWTRQDPRERLEVLRVGLEPADAVVVDRLHHRVVDGCRDTHAQALPADVTVEVIDLRPPSAEHVL